MMHLNYTFHIFNLIKVKVRVASEYNVANSTIWRWHKKFNWEERAHLRNIEINKQVEKKTNTAIADNKAKYLTFIHKLFDDWKKKRLIEEKFQLKLDPHRMLIKLLNSHYCYKMKQEKLLKT